MAVYAIGDVQGCHTELAALLASLNFDADRDTLWFTGDLVNRGDASLATLRLVRSLGKSAISVLGNHDLHLLAVAAGVARQRRRDTLTDVLQAPDADELLHWLRQLPLVHYDATLNCVLLHAGVPPQWDLQRTLSEAAAVETRLRGKHARKVLRNGYARERMRWREDFGKREREAFTIACLTRARYCTANGTLHFRESGAPGTQPGKLMPWFDVPGRKMTGQRIVFGHWSTLGCVIRDNLVALDTGCVWGGKLTAQRLDQAADPVQVECHGYQNPG